MRRDFDSSIANPTVLIAAADASEISKRKADWVVGEPQTKGFAAKIQRIWENGGRIHLEGIFGPGNPYDLEETDDPS